MINNPFGVRLKDKFVDQFAALVKQEGVNRNLLINRAVGEFLERNSTNNQKPSEAA